MVIKNCEICDEPATHSCLLVRPDGKSQHHYCYSHAAENGLFETPLNLLEPIAVQSGYSVNAIIFVVEALVRGSLIDDSNSDNSKATILSSFNIQNACDAINRSAVERFGYEARAVLERWNITRTDDVGNILIPLVDAGILAISENSDRFLREINLRGLESANDKRNEH